MNKSFSSQQKPNLQTLLNNFASQKTQERPCIDMLLGLNSQKICDTFENFAKLTFFGSLQQMCSFIAKL